MKIKLLLAILCTTSLLYGQRPNTLQLHPQNPHYFLYRQKPLVIIGSGEHYGAVVNLDFNYKKYLQTIAQDGLNTTRLFTGAYIEKLGDFGIQRNTLAPATGRVILPWARSTASGYTLGGNKFDLEKWDEAYFSRLRDFLEEAQRLNIIVEVTLFSSHYADGWKYSALNRSNNVNSTDSIASRLVNTLQNGNLIKHQERYVRKIVQELNSFDNLYFEIQNEPWADQTDTVLVRNEYGPDNDWRSTLQVVSEESNRWQRQVSLWIKDAEKNLPKKHLVSQNISNFHYPITNPDPNVSIFNFHYSNPLAVQDNYHLNRPIGFNETGFSGKADLTYRKQAWRFIISGGTLFNHLDYSFSVGHENGDDAEYTAPGGGSAALRKEFSVLKKLIERFNFVPLQPDYSIVTVAPGAMTLALSNARTEWIIYYEPMDREPHELQLKLPTGSYEIEWMDVSSGKTISKSTIQYGKILPPAIGGDKVLLIKKK